jgi:magnesium transporter
VLNIINSYHLEDLKNQNHPSIFTKDQDYDLFIFRVPLHVENKIKAKNLSFIIRESEYYMYDHGKESLIALNGIDEFYNILNRHLDESMKLMNEQYMVVEDIEDIFYDGKHVHNFNQKWIQLKNDTIKIHRILYKGIDALNMYIKNYKNSPDFLEAGFSDLLEHLQRTYRNSEHLLVKIDALYDYYTTSNNEQMNKIVYILTIISAIFLPLNFIVGFFGMNTTSLPYTQGNDGTLNVVMILSTMAIISTLAVMFVKKRSKNIEI